MPMQRLLANLMAVIRQSGLLLLDLLPYVVAGALVGALLLRRRNSIFSTRLFKLPIPGLIFFSALLGTVSPLCTMGTVPVVIGMVGCGFPISVGMAFLAASSLVNPQMLFIAFSTIGPALTVTQWLSGIGTGCTAGLLTILFEKQGIAIVNKKLDVPAGQNISSNQKHTGFFSNFLDQLEHVLFFVIGGTLAASIINVWLPEPLLFKLFSGADSFDVAAGAVLSIPMYVCGGGVLPVMEALMKKGLSSGAVLAFIIVGPATRLQALAALGAFMSKRALVFYIILICTWAVVAGIVFNTFF